MLDVSGRVVVVGGANTDVLGVSDAPLIAHEKNPGRVTLSSGGVGRNIAENLARLGVDVALITAFGSDAQARTLTETCRDVGIDVSASLVTDDLPGSYYLAVVDHDGEVALAVSDMRPLDRLTLDVLAGKADVLEEADLVVVDANIPADSLTWIAEHVDIPLLLDPVSVAKAMRAKTMLGEVHTLKASAAEAEVLTGADTADIEGVEQAAGSLLAAGVQRTFVTCGEQGVYAAERGRSGWYPAPDVDVVDATGAGDAFTAGVAFAMLAGYGLDKTCAIGSAMAALTLTDESAVSERISTETLEAVLEETEA